MDATSSPAFQATSRFQKRMKPAALKIYERVFPGCRLEDLRENGVKVHILDKEFGIDSLVHLDGGQWISLQEKYRRHSSLHWLEFTQEYMNAAGTKYESPGEWFKLGAQLYFYGWANNSQTAFEKWALIDIAKYKMLVEKAGGLDKLGTLEQNSRYGKSTFYAIKIMKLASCFVCTYKDFPESEVAARIPQKTS